MRSGVTWLVWACAVIVLGCTSSSERSPRFELADIEGARCTEDDWCWVRGRELQAVSGLSLDRVVVTGDEGYFAHWVEGAWVAQPLPVRRFVTAGAAEDVERFWATDEEGKVWRFAEGEWTEASVDDTPMAGVTVTADGTIWAYEGASLAHGVAVMSALWRRDGDTWVHHVDAIDTCVGPGQLLPRSHDEVLIAVLTCEDTVGVSNAEVRRWTGSDWQLMGQPVESGGWYPSLTESHGELVLSARGALYQWSDDAWQPIDAPEPPQDLPEACSAPLELEGESFCVKPGQVMHRSAPDVVWRETIEHPLDATLDARFWGQVPTRIWAGGAVSAAWGRDPDDVYRIADATGLEHYDGTDWQLLTDEYCYDVSGHEDGAVFAACTSGLRPIEGDQLMPPLSVTSETSLLRVFARPDGSAILLNSDELLRWTGKDTEILYDSAQALDSGDDRFLGWGPSSVAVRDDDDIWLQLLEPNRTPRRALLHHDGDDWDVVSVEDTENRMSSLAQYEDEIWMWWRGQVQRIDPAGPTYDCEWEVPIADLEVSDEHLWVITRDQVLARRR